MPPDALVGTTSDVSTFALDPYRTYPITDLATLAETRPDVVVLSTKSVDDGTVDTSEAVLRWLGTHGTVVFRTTGSAVGKDPSWFSSTRSPTAPRRGFLVRTQDLALVVVGLDGRPALGHPVRHAGRSRGVQSLDPVSHGPDSPPRRGHQHPRGPRRPRAGRRPRGAPWPSP